MRTSCPDLPGGGVTRTRAVHSAPKPRITIGVVAVGVALALLALAGLQVPRQASDPQGPAPSGNGTIVFIGAVSGFAGDTLVLVAPRYVGPAVLVTELAALADVAAQVDGTSLVMFNSEWLVGNVGEAALTDFFKTILPTQMKIVALGGETSLLFEALKHAKADIFAEGRNPAYYNPPLAGYKLRQATDPNGMPYYGESLVFGNSENASEAADGIVNWG